MTMTMMQRIVCRSAGRRMQQHVARKQAEACRSLSSATTAIATIPLNGNSNINFSSNNSSSSNSIAVATRTHTTTTTNTNTNTTCTSGTSKRSFSSNSNDDDTVGGRSSSQPQGSSELRRAYVHPLSQVVLEYLQEHHHSWIVCKGLDRSLRLHRDGSFEAKYVPLSSSSSSYAAAASTSTSASTSASTSTYPPLSPLSSIHDSNRSGSTEPVISESMSATATMKMNASGNAYASTTSSSSIHIHNDNENDNDTATSKTASTGPAAIGPFQELAATTATNTDNHNQNDNDNIRIWTSFDEQEKKHWLTVRKGLFRQRFLLQDNLLTAWQGNRGTSLPERIHLAVDEMIRAVDRLDNDNNGQQQHQHQHQHQQRQQQKQSSPHAMMGHYQQWQQKDQMQFPKR
mmetsp:Transcript_22927/g.46678  ORF Transcript_22927/g.46678 Transcript_22927/m.46678 type:complete len:402 (+) Transcript_22927:410-1615(+)